MKHYQGQSYLGKRLFTILLTHIWASAYFRAFQGGSSPLMMTPMMRVFDSTVRRQQPQGRNLLSTLKSSQNSKETSAFSTLELCTGWSFCSEYVRHPFSLNMHTASSRKPSLTTRRLEEVGRASLCRGGMGAERDHRLQGSPAEWPLRSGVGSPAWWGNAVCR